MSQIHARGIVLFQVLVIVAITSILVLLAVAASQQAVRQTYQLQQSVEQQLALYSARNHLLLSLLTTPWLGPAASAQGWNFYGQPFSWQLPNSPAYAAVNYRVTVINQDESGLISIHSPGANLTKLLLANGVSSLQANNMLTSLQQAQQLYPSPAGQSVHHNYPYLRLQNTAELAQLPHWDDTVVAKLADKIVFTNLLFNPASAPDSTLSALLPAAQADIIRQWRATSEFSLDRFSALTGIYSDEIQSLYPGRIMQLTINSDLASASLSTRVSLDPYHPRQPVVIHYEFLGRFHYQHNGIK